MPGLYGPQHPLSAECAERITLARIALVTQYPFFGIIACRLEPVEDNIRCQTLATDGKRLYYNVNFVMGIEASLLNEEEKAKYDAALRKAFPQATEEQIQEMKAGLSDRQLRGGVVHEIMHCMMEHFIRKNNREHQKWNRACDYAINQIIKRELEQRDRIAEIKKTWLYDPKYDNMSAEEIYNLLDEQEQQGEDGQGSSFDHHYDPDSPPSGSSSTEESGKDRGTAGSIFDDLSPEEIQENFEDFKESVMSAAMASEVPAGLKRMLEDLQEPKINWRTKVRRTLQSWMKHDMAFRRPNRKSWSIGCILPGFLPQEEIDLCIALDMSGSITQDMAREMLSEVYGMTKQFNCFKIKLLTFDTRVYNPQDFDENNIADLWEYDVKGGGGTEFMAVWEHMKAENYKPKQLIMFTDGYPCGEWGDSEYCETLFVIHGTTTIKAPFGQTVYYEFEGEHA